MPGLLVPAELNGHFEKFQTTTTSVSVNKQTARRCRDEKRAVIGVLARYYLDADGTGNYDEEDVLVWMSPPS